MQPQPQPQPPASVAASRTMTKDYKERAQDYHTLPGSDELDRILNEYERTKADHMAELDRNLDRALSRVLERNLSQIAAPPDPKAWSEAKLERFRREADTSKEEVPMEAQRPRRVLRRRLKSAARREQSRDQGAQDKIPAIVMRAGGPSIGDVFPNLTGATQLSDSFDLHEYLGNSWGIVFMHPADFTPVCTTELGQAAKMVDTFKAKNVKLCGFSCDDTQTHWDWIKDIYIATGGYVRFPLFADPTRENASNLGILDRDEVSKRDGLPVTVRAVYVLKPDRTVALTMTYPLSLGRNFDEILRVVTALQLTEEDKSVATPADWNRGEDVIVAANMSDAEADEKFGKGGFRTVDLPSEEGKNLKRHYLRYAPDPSSPSPSYDKLVRESSSPSPSPSFEKLIEELSLVR